MLIGVDASRALRAKRTGVERYALEIIRHLLALPEAAPHAWRLYVDGPAERTLFGLPPAPHGPEVEFCLLPRRRLWTHRALAREVVARRPDVLFVPAHVLPFVLPTSRLPPSVVTIHDMGYRHFPTAHTWAQRYYLELSTRWSAWAATQLIAVSQATATDLARFYATPRHKVAVIHEAGPGPARVSETDVTQTLARHGITRPYLLYVGSIQPRKNLVRLLDAYAQASGRGGLHCDLVLVGGGGWLADPIYAHARKLAVRDRIHLLGYTADDDLPALYRGAQGFCFPSLFEGFGLPVLEAQSYGTPVMTATNSSLPEIAGDAAILVDPTDVDAIADAMLRLSQDESLRQRLIAAGHENVKRFSWRKAAQETLAVLLAAATAKR
ncbi:MAG: glycosyltransferase family 4 protein [Caldilineaceae bacterium]|nr:glycosyltransferase family 4 protein [Caldilineaceae bacterium]